jgi:sugar phosphate isomerase/epimerase
MERIERRKFLRLGTAAAMGLATPAGKAQPEADMAAGKAAPAATAAPPFKLGTVTYNLAKDWDLETIIRNCEATGFEAVELRTTHRHGVELSLSKAQRAEVRKQFESSRVRLLSLGTTCEYHSADAGVVRKNIEETKQWCELARDLGCLGVKVRPNGFVPGVEEAKTLEQIGKALAECGPAARDAGVEIWVEVHGRGTELPRNMRRIMDVANHPAVGICWNSNDPDIEDGSVKPAFELLKAWIRNVHINELWRTLPPWRTVRDFQPPKGPPGFPDWQRAYPWRELFSLLRGAGYARYTLAEIPASCEPERLMRYYRALWELLVV